MRRLTLFTSILTIFAAIPACDDDAGSGEGTPDTVATGNDFDFDTMETHNSNTVRQLITYVKPENFTEEVLKSNYPVVVDFYADWCNPCKYMAPYFKKFAETYPDVKFVKYDVDQDDFKDPWCVSGLYGIDAIPTFDFFYLGEEYTKFRFTGADAETLESNIASFVKEIKMKYGKKKPWSLEFITEDSTTRGEYCSR
jgi:thioredoxin 1